MKRIILSLILLSPLFALSQTYHPLVSETSLWSVYHYYCKADNNPFSQYVKFQGDVILNDTVYKQIWVCEDTLTEPWATYGLIREDAQKRVWVRSSPQFAEMLMYDFSALPGDTLWLNANPYLYIMGDQDSIQLLDGTWRKQYHLIYAVWPDCNEVWIEGIGCLKGVLESGTCSFVGDSPSLICGLSHDTILYHNSLFEECHVITGIPHPDTPAFRVSPNPASGAVNIEFPGPMPQGTLILTDITGRIARQVPIMIGTTSLRIDLTGLQSGVYFLGTPALTTHPVKILVR